MVQRTIDKTLVNKEFRYAELDQAVEEAIIWLNGAGHFAPPAKKKKPPPRKKVSK